MNLPKIKSNTARRQRKEIAVQLILGFGTVLSLSFLVMICVILIMKGWRGINWDFFLNLPAPVGDIGGGISNAILGSLILGAVALLISCPLGIWTGIMINELPHRKISKLAKMGSEIFHGVPTIVVGILAYIWIVIPMKGFSGLSGGIALGLIMLPTIVNATEESFRAMPGTLREASLSLGVPYYKTILFVVLPNAARGISSGILIGFGRVLGEAAPLLFTAFGHQFMQLNLLKPLNAVPLLIYSYGSSPYDDWQQIAWAASLILVAFIFIVNVSMKVVFRHDEIRY